MPKLDSEAKGMLAYYHALADFSFPNLRSHPKLEALLETEAPAKWSAQDFDVEVMRTRGLMGEYWLSVFGSNAT